MIQLQKSAIFNEKQCSMNILWFYDLVLYIMKRFAQKRIGVDEGSRILDPK